MYLKAIIIATVVSSAVSYTCNSFTKLTPLVSYFFITQILILIYIEYT